LNFGLIAQRLCVSAVKYFWLMWDAKRQAIWLTTALILVTVVVIPQAYDETGKFDLSYFILLEIIFLAVVITMFYIYSRRKN
jgi:hypothetical protein